MLLQGKRAASFPLAPFAFRVVAQHLRCPRGNFPSMLLWAYSLDILCLMTWDLGKFSGLLEEWKESSARTRYHSHSYYLGERHLPRKELSFHTLRDAEKVKTPQEYCQASTFARTSHP